MLIIICGVSLHIDLWKRRWHSQIILDLDKKHISIAQFTHFFVKLLIIFKKKDQNIFFIMLDLLSECDAFELVYLL